MQFVPFTNDVWVSGVSISAVVQGFTHFPSRSKKFLAEHNLSDAVDEKGIPIVAGNKWFRMEDWLAAYRDIAKEVGEKTLFVIGQKVPENATFPPTVKDIFTGIQSIDIAFHLNHKLGEKMMFDTIDNKMLEGIGHYGYDRRGDREIVSVCENPYPCSFDHGLITSMARKFQPRAKVEHAEGTCRKTGADACTYVITW